MTATERRIALIRLLAEIDQQARKAEELAFNPDISREQRELAVVQWEFRRIAVQRVEKLLKPSER